MSSDPQNLLVTGVAGFLGSNLLGKLLSEGHSVEGIDNLSKGSLDNIRAHLNDKNFVFMERDIL